MTAEHHHHHHDHHHPEADWLTTTSKYTTLISSVIGNAFTFGSLIDATVGITSVTCIGLSPWAIGFGVPIALYAAWGYSHSEAIKNTNYQTHQTANLLPATDQLSSSYQLNRTQKAALTGGYINLTGDYFATLSLVIDLAIKANLIKLILKYILLLGAAIAAVADARTWKNNMYLYNAGGQLQASTNGENKTETAADCWVKSNFVAEIVTGSVSNLYWLGNMVDSLAELSEDFISLSWYGFGFGCIGIVASFGAAYCHWVTNKRHQAVPIAQQAPAAETSAESQPNISCAQKAALIFDGFEHTGEVAAPMTLVPTVATNRSMPLYGKILTQCFAVLFAIPSAAANVRTCKENIERDKAEQAKPGNAPSYVALTATPV